MATNPGSAALAGNSGEAGAGAPPAGQEQQGGQGGGAGAGDGGKPWFEQAGIDAKYSTAIAAKGWTNPNDILESYTNVEKLVSLERGGDVDRIIVKPKADAAPEEVAAFRSKAGFAAPADAKEYGFTPETIGTTAGELFGTSGLTELFTKSFTADGKTPEEAATLTNEVVGKFVTEMSPVVEAAAGWMKDAGIPVDMANGLVKNVLAKEVEGLKTFHENSNREWAALQQELGDKLGDFTEAGARAFRTIAKDVGITQDDIAAVEMKWGTAKLMKMFAKFGGAMSEASAPQPGKTGQGQFQQTADQAKSRIDVLSRDSDFQARLNSPNPEMRKVALAEWEALFKTAAGT